MTSEWPIVTIEEIAQKVAMGPFGSSIKVETFRDAGIPVISGQHLRTSRLRDVAYNFISFEHAEKLANANVMRGDVVFTHAGNIGQVAYIPEHSRYERYVISQRQFYVRPDPSKVIPEYLAYYFESPAGRHQLLANASSSGVPSIAQPVTYLRKVRISLPPLAEQRRIARIIGSLDDKIELNRRMNETLEAMAGALFKSWFVDFDPTRAKATGLDTGLPRQLADLFPDSFEDSELGTIPIGWRVSSLGELSDRPQYGYTASARDKPVGPKFLRITDINKSPWIEWSSVPHCEIGERELEHYRVRSGDILIARMADPGHGVLIEEDVDAVFASYLIRFRPADTVYARFLQYWLRSDSYWGLVGGRHAGTTRASLNARVLAGFPVIQPPWAIAHAFDRAVSALRSRVNANVAETRTLELLRDGLLPILMSGTKHVADL